MVKVHGMGGRKGKRSKDFQKAFEKEIPQTYRRRTRRAKGNRKTRMLARLPFIIEPHLLESQGFRRKEFFTQIQNCGIDLKKPETAKAFILKVWNGVKVGRISTLESLFLKFSADSCTRGIYSQKTKGNEFKILEDEERERIKTVLVKGFNLGWKRVERLDRIFSSCFNTVSLGIRLDLTS